MRIVSYLHKGVVAVAAAALAITTLVVAYQIVGRYVPFIPRALWTEEIARMCLVWLVFMGAAASIRTGEHFIIDLVPERASDNLKRIFATFTMVALVAISVTLFVGSIGFTQTGLDRISTTSGLSLVYSFAAPLVASPFMAVFAIAAWWEAMKDPSLSGANLTGAEVVEAAQGDDEDDSSAVESDVDSATATNGKNSPEGSAK
ncbi:TRAP transporter small permease [Parenemella sanctibonifatiensis]|uniref:Tripartite ATP-independent periplasmic transporters DctQ component domain-containing protein n=1 Tax=Parenemella sanctibonifatiensis TaxID=2016505 RepID=A0A255E7K0_9ACTN|nr:TRAP transporter small permease [Parenemella sanctibonifatiensis]OYN84093.1 hypothetical protein CGZ92_13665 [Parenemella sanctibonifatiensis]